MLTDTEIQLARRDFAELRELIIGKTITGLISEVKGDSGHPIDICHILDADAGETTNYDLADMVDINFKSLNLTIFKDKAGLCSIDDRQTSIEIYSWYDKQNDDMPIGEISYEEITKQNTTI